MIHIDIPSRIPLIIVEVNGRKTRYSKVVAIVKLKTYHAQSKMNAFFHNFDINILLAMAVVTFYVKCKLIWT